jgi:hypothetical protein
MPRLPLPRRPTPPRPRLTTRGLLAVSALVGVLFALSTVLSVGLSPPSLHARQVTVAAASTHVFVDGRRSLIGVPTASDFDYDGFSRRAALYSNLIASPPVAAQIAHRMGVRPDELAARARLTLAVQWAMRDPDFEQRANQLVVADRPYKLELQPDPIRPILNVYAQAPSVAKAQQLADTAVTVLRDDLTARALEHEQDPGQGILLTQLGPARGGVINGQVIPQMVMLAFLVAFGVCLMVLTGARRIRAGWVAAAREQRETAVGGPDAAGPAVAGVAAASSGRLATMRQAVGPGGDWPHTTRLIPWMIAGFLVLLWLVPFNAIQLSVTLPFDAKLDRLILPFLFGFWLLALAVGGPTAPRMRLTLIHVGLALFVAAVSLSIVVNTPSLNQTLEFDQSVKKLTLLMSYALLFTIVASCVRRSEVEAFLKLMLVLSVITALGVIWEYRFHYNIFYDIPHRVLPGIFTVGVASLDARDDIGRVMTFGPTDHPLEITGMLTMALPIALIGILGSSERRTRILYGIAACILLAAAISTYRKSALLGPVAVILVIAYFRRRELLRLAPLGVVALGAIHLLSPGALGSILFQLHPTRLDVATVSDRAADYDAVRPDVWSHLIFGRGYGSYDHLSYRILDSDMLSRLVDTGIVGVLSIIFMLLSIVIAGRSLIARRDPQWSSPTLAVAAAAIAFLVLMFLFDVTSFPHVPYILFAMAALAAVVVADAAEPEAPSRLTLRHRRPVPVRSPARPLRTARPVGAPAGR